MEDAQLERYKLATLEVLESLGGIASDTRFLADSVFLSLDDVPSEDPDYDYEGLSLALAKARDALLKEGKVTLTDGRIWRLARQIETAELTFHYQYEDDSIEDELWNRMVVEQFFAGYSEDDEVYDKV